MIITLLTADQAVLFTVWEFILSRMSLSNGHAILVPTASPSEDIVVVGLHTYASLSAVKVTTTAAALGPIGILVQQSIVLLHR